MSTGSKNIKWPTEKNVAQYLDKKEIEYKPQFPVCLYDEDRNLRIWYPDFYLPTLGLYLEVCGTEKDKMRKLRRKHVYEENEITVVFIHYYKSDSMWTGYLDNEIQRIENNRLVESEKLKPS